MRKILLFLTAGFLAMQPLQAAEKLQYVVKMKGAVTLFSWKSLADASLITTAGARCGTSRCSITRVWMTSENHALLESLSPTRFLYRSFYQHNPARTLAFEKRQMKTKQNYQPYGYKHQLVVLSANKTSMQHYTLWNEGSALPSAASVYVDEYGLNGVQPLVKKSTEVAIKPDALDRWAMIQLTRELPLASGFSGHYPGTNGSAQLRFDLKVEAQEELVVAGKSWSSWKVSIVENNLKRKKQQPPLYLWISQDGRHLPLRVEMEEDIGRVRFDLTSY